MDTLKRAFKGLFKRGKKSKQDRGPQETPQEQEHASTSLEEPTPVVTTSATPPQIPPVQSSSPLQTPEEEASKHLPPTHPLVTGQHTQPQEAVPQNRNAEPGPPSKMARIAPMDTADLVRERKKATPLESFTEVGDDAKDDEGLATQHDKPLPPLQTTSQSGGGTNISTVSSAEDPDTLVSPPKTDSGIGAEKGEDPTDTRKENTQPVTNGIPVANEEKVAVMQDEPPPIKAVRAAPGMSATSGPLEDFPEGGDVHYDEHSS